MDLDLPRRGWEAGLFSALCRFGSRSIFGSHFLLIFDPLLASIWNPVFASWPSLRVLKMGLIFDPPPKATPIDMLLPFGSPFWSLFRSLWGSPLSLCSKTRKRGNTYKHNGLSSFRPLQSHPFSIKTALGNLPKK